MAMLKVIGIWLDESGWSCVMTSANVTTEERVAGFMKVSVHIKLWRQHCVFFFKSHTQSLNSTLLMMNRWHMRNG